MLAEPQDIRARIDHLSMSRSGFEKQLRGLELAAERAERLQHEVSLLVEEIGVLEKLLNLTRAESDRHRVEEIVRDRVKDVQASLETDPALAEIPLEDRYLASGEARGLLWALGEDRLSMAVREMSTGRGHTGAAAAIQGLPEMLLRALRSGEDLDKRAGAAHELGVLHVVEALPQLAALASEAGVVGEVAAGALSRFSDEELEAAGVPDELVAVAREGRRKRNE